ncbi:hypothetical protein BD289DRAFT_190243 [Coniella lustricola]|uniref:Uncharacterized protein n=1 Tax=Coniella lustricola TaxID=2025994 RepID=A0A2T3ACY0_9PEZI|nr:hypothetical protein BD289DRAFT_190243 [Coniella lustricola]
MICVFASWTTGLSQTCSVDSIQASFNGKQSPVHHWHCSSPTPSWKLLVTCHRHKLTACDERLHPPTAQSNERRALSTPPFWLPLQGDVRQITLRDVRQSQLSTPRMTPGRQSQSPHDEILALTHRPHREAIASNNQHEATERGRKCGNGCLLASLARGCRVTTKLIKRPGSVRGYSKKPQNNSAEKSIRTDRTQVSSSTLTISTIIPKRERHMSMSRESSAEVTHGRTRQLLRD